MAANENNNNGTEDEDWVLPLTSRWAEHWFTGVACAIFANILIFYVTRIYGRRIALQRVLQQRERRVQKKDSFFDEMDNPPEVIPEAGSATIVPPHLSLGPLRNRGASAEPRSPQQPDQDANLSPFSSKAKVDASFLTAPLVVESEEKETDPGDAQDTPGAQPHPKSVLLNPLTTPNQDIEKETKKHVFVRVGILGLLIQAFQFAALSIVSLAMVVPLSCLFFVWWRVATLESTRRRVRKNMSQPNKINVILYFSSLRKALTLRFFSITLTLVVANSLVIAFGPHRMYVVAVHKVVTLDIGLMIYITIILLIILFQGTLGQARPTMERAAKFFGLKKVTDLEPLILGCNTGLLGGQYMLLVKLLAEIAEASLLMPSKTAPGEETFIIVIFALVVGVFHLQGWRRGMGLPRTKLFIPVYRFFLVISGILASILVLREFFESSAVDVALFSVGVGLDLALLFLLCKNAIQAVKRDDFSTVIFLEEDPEQGIEMKSPRNAGNKNRFTLSQAIRNRQGAVPPPDLRRIRSAPGNYVGSRVARTTSLDSLLDLVEPTPTSGRRGRRTARPYHDQSDMFFSFGADQCPTPRPPSSRRNSSDSLSRLSAIGLSSHHPQQFRRRVSSRRSTVDDDTSDSDGYESAGSFHSAPDLHLHEFAKSDTIVTRAGSLNKIVVLDYEYTSPMSMIVPKGAFNPWAPQGQSYYYDCAAVPGSFKVRGADYLIDGQKIKCDLSRMKLVMGEWIYNPDTPVKNICNDPAHFVQREHVGRKNRPFLFVVNLMVPSVGNAVFTWCRRPNLETDEVFERMLDEFIHHPNDQFRNKMFKIIPGVPEGSFIAKKAVGNKPAMICDKVPTTYYRGDNWFEVCIDCAQSRVAFSVMGAIKGFASTLTLQLGFLLESNSPETLPERLLGGITIVKPQMVPNPQKSPVGEGGVQQGNALAVS